MILPEELKKVEFLRELSEQHFNQIAKIATLKECEPGAVVFRQGECSPSFFIVLDGKISLRFRGPGKKSVEISTVGPGELLGWSPVLGRQAMSATAKAVTRSRLAVLDVKRVLDLCEHNARFGVAFLVQVGLVMSERLWAARRSLARALSNRPVNVGEGLSTSE